MQLQSKLQRESARTTATTATAAAKPARAAAATTATRHAAGDGTTFASTHLTPLPLGSEGYWETEILLLGAKKGVGRSLKS